MSAPLKLVSETPPRHEKASADRAARLEDLLVLEGEIRDCRDPATLQHIAVNGLRSRLDVQQVFLLIPDLRKRGTFKITKVSGIANVDPNAPAVVALSKAFSAQLKELVNDTKSGAARAFDAASLGELTPFDHGVAAFLRWPDGSPLAAIVALGEKSLPESALRVLERLAATIGHAWSALLPKQTGLLRSVLQRKVLWGLGIAAALAMAIPVPLSTLAPVEVVAKDPWVVAAPIDGVVEGIEIAPNSPVAPGDVLFRYVDTDLAARATIAARNRDVATARLQTINQTAFSSAEGRRDLAGARAELALAGAEHDYAQHLLKRSVVTAPVAGLAIFDRRSTWQGRPVATGEAVMEIADPSRIAFRVDLSVSDSIVLKPDAEVKLFLDSNPLAPRRGKVVEAGYRAQPTPDGTLAYRVLVESHDGKPPRIGSRGTAQIFGEDVSLGFYLFRRPFTAIRQWLGV